ncbi:hypothetical protein [Antribacter gilvus]|uniref:hypothetical protein n=1 Tax=Antribacter gilvus TaxID=2304675 RepID=UPI000F7AAAFD|nr:hypothetical protein [Antribacter gilvus]
MTDELPAGDLLGVPLPPEHFAAYERARSALAALADSADDEIFSRYTWTLLRIDQLHHPLSMMATEPLPEMTPWDLYAIAGTAIDDLAQYVDPAGAAEARTLLDAAWAEDHGRR